MALLYEARWRFYRLVYFVPLPPLLVELSSF